METVLSTERLSVRYGGVHALSEVGVEIAPGQLVGLIGPNGAGKTTFIDAISGFAPSTGTIRLGGQSLAGMSAHGRARAGIARTWQSTMLFDDLTIEENLTVAASRTPWWRALGGVLNPRPSPRRAAHDLLLELDLGELAGASPDALTEGQRKLVGVARALAGGPKLLCLDEPAAGLDTVESQDLGARLRRIADGGTTTLLIDHDMGLVLSICDHIVVLDFGRVIFQGSPSAARGDTKVIEAYLGASATRSTSDPPGALG